MGLYFKKIRLPAITAEQFCDSDGDYQREYSVYKISVNGRDCVLKKSESREIELYRTFLRGKGFSVPEYRGEIEADGQLWLLMEYIEGPDLRRFDEQMALACAETLAELQNAYWDSEADGGRFQKYWERIHQRAMCLENDPELAEAYRIFLERQRDCPRTLSNGDFLPLNGIFRDGRVYIIDWGFGGILPYALDLARLIAHGTEKPEKGGFPFYMNDGLRRTFLRAHYEKLAHKPDWDQYLTDIRLAVLNEYVEFWEADHTNEFYLRRAKETAKEILRTN